MTGSRSHLGNGRVLFGQGPNSIAGSNASAGRSEERPQSQHRDPTEALQYYFSRLKEDVKVEFLRTIDPRLLQKAGYAPLAAPAQTPAPAVALQAAQPQQTPEIASSRKSERIKRNDHVLLVLNNGEVVVEGVLLDKSKHGARIAVRAASMLPSDLKMVESSNGLSYLARKVWCDDGEIGIAFSS